MSLSPSPNPSRETFSKTPVQHPSELPAPPEAGPSHCRGAEAARCGAGPGRRSRSSRGLQRAVTNGNGRRRVASAPHLRQTCRGEGRRYRGNGVRGVRRLSLLSGWLSCESKSAPKVAVHGQQQSATGRACACPPRPRHAGVSHTSPCTPGAPGVAPGQGTRPFVHGGLPADPQGEWLPRGPGV